MDDSTSAAQQLADYFEPDGFPGFTLDDGRAWTSAQVRQVLTHHREFLRQMIEPTVRAVLAENREMQRQIEAMGNQLQEAKQTLEVVADEAQSIGRLAERRGRTLVGPWQPADGGE